MFRSAAQTNPLDDAVVKATDENLTSENWADILDVCDRVSSTPAGPQHAISALIKRLAHRNANVQLYTLELANALSQNCGAPVHRELASKAFTDSLLRLAADRNTHGQVKQKVLERMENWTEEFRNNPELGIMEQAYGKLRTQQPGLQAPSKPVKQQISHEDRRKEEEELQMALALSVQDKAATSPQPPANGGSDQVSQAQPGAQQGTTAATVSRVKALYDFAPSEPGELAFAKGDVIAVLESVYKDWWKGSLKGQTGIFPLNYVEKIADPTKEDLERDAQMEAEVFGEIKNVEKLLALLSVGEGRSRRGEREEEEIGDLYQRTLSIRPKLIELIGKYSQKKEEFTQLNEKFIKARRDYEHLLEDSMKAPQPYQQYPVRQRQPAYPLQQQPPYGGPQQGLPPGYPPPQGYPSQAPYASQSQQHLPAQQDPQRIYSSAPSESPAPQQQGYGSPYPPQDGPPPMQPQLSGQAAPFHFIPGGLQGPPPPQQQQQPQQPPQLSPQDHQIRRKPSPHGLAPQPTQPYAGQPPQPFLGQIRPNSIHTINSGNPQELATGGYESPVDNRHSYPPAQQMQHPPPQQPGYPPDTYPPQPQTQAYPPQHQQQQPIHSDRDALPSRQRTQSFGSPTSLYSAQQSMESAPFPSQQPSAPPPGIPGDFGGPSGQQPPPQQGYQAYQPFVPTAGQPPQGPVGGGDPGDFYR
ncbi:ESCRT-0 subunit protein hse1 [Meristemomyces frigidus]|uniref:Class E vacuolar protein-sorting machinery protein HSE1 n=1 Tax=Meristemomyces frigidus TaxID=1508187 RepID=A0AAN7TIL2_9PEZI|nr:ESCRT-0 subunit protein hse1 [Meristemomyces frigidus]